ncbi:MAG: zf-TFIIB domain-containing protein [Okeania sp. SIO3H1]|uniref:TFIIB-type zinc ribbon-containing protein n=1 Tax=Okeania sp. SIO1I7 TaxID=2607772 RepID=UPI0013CCC2EF|nr:zf-TFIIB domain-containing protein [Okeania sp. SIO1I7]NEN91700.1 zf-TFIIB domain-containing protein [Okeania sp. SIO3H1]NET25170.1 zf-TFIIB domain-containing protein [Okeania sp. SIO1I7]
MKSPKYDVDLEDAVLNDNIPVKYCPESKGFWISGKNYEAWLDSLPSWYVPEEILPYNQFEDFVPSPFDGKAGLCPECGTYLSRIKINIKQPFYIERCLHDGGIWFDNSEEWKILESLGLHTKIHEMFSSRWQAKMRQHQQEMINRQTIIDKLGEEIAEYVFKLADILEDNPHGDCAATYMLRRFENKRKELNGKFSVGSQN